MIFLSRSDQELPLGFSSHRAMILGLAYISICITSPFFLQADKQQSSFKSGVAYPEIKKPNPFFSGPKGEGE